MFVFLFQYNLVALKLKIAIVDINFNNIRCFENTFVDFIHLKKLQKRFKNI